MNKIKRIIIEEAARVLREMKNKKNVSDVKINLYEAIKTAETVKNNPKKYRIAKKLLSISESKFIKERQKLKEDHGHEDESEMARAQLLAIMEKANELYRMMDGVSQLEDWLQYKLSIAENYIDAIHGYMKYFNGGTEMDQEEMYNDNDQWDDVEEEDFDDEDFENFDDDDEDFDTFDDVDDFDDEYDGDDEDSEYDDEEEDDSYFSV